MKEGYRVHKADRLGWLLLILIALYFLLHPNTVRMLKPRPACEARRGFVELDYDDKITPEVNYAK